MYVLLFVLNFFSMTDAVLFLQTVESSGYVALYDTPVDERSADIHEQNGKHHALGIARVHNAHYDGDDADEEAIDPLAAFRACCGDRVGCHKHCTEGEAAEHKMVNYIQRRHS